MDSPKCAACHSSLSFVHSSMRNDAQERTLCHNPTLVDGTSNQSVNMARQIHSIRRGENLANQYILGTSNYQDVRLPRRLHQEDTSHLRSLPGLHDDKASASPALANTTAIGESCAACHTAGEEFWVDRVHQRIF